LWEEAAAKLIEEFCRRCPTLQDITKLYGTLRNTTRQNIVQREVTLRLLALYHEVLPQIALEENFDVSIPLTNALQDIEDTTLDGDKTQLRLLELSHLVKIANWSSSVHWLGKVKGLNYSPLVTLLRLLARRPPQAVKDIKELVKGILKDGDAVQVDTDASGNESGPSALDALIVSLRRNAITEQLPTSGATYSFLDKCFHRFSTRPIKYEDDKDALMNKNGLNEQISQPCSLISMTVLEQWPFEQENKAEVGNWINNFLQLLIIAKDALAHAVDTSQMLEDLDLHKYQPSQDRVSLRQELETSLRDYINSEERILSKHAGDAQLVLTSEAVDDRPAFDLSSFAPPSESENHPVLTRYRKKDFTTLIDDGDLRSLVHCLTSPYLSIRIQAITALRSVMASLSTSTLIDKDMMYLLLGELLETCTANNINEKPLASIAVVFAAKSVSVLRDPTHALYVKVNEFLNKGPVWKVRAMCVHWLEQVLLHPPSDADTEGAYWREVVWVLEWLVDGLRTDEDFDIIRRNGVFEKLMAVFFHPAMDKRRLVELVTNPEALARESSLQAKVRPLILRLLVRAGIVGGATVLVTGSGALAWLNDVRSLVANENGAVRLVEDIEKVLLEHAEGSKIRDWSSGTLKSKEKEKHISHGVEVLE
jgi:nucleolar pre-ribosomal-associated protein 1